MAAVSTQSGQLPTTRDACSPETTHTRTSHRIPRDSTTCRDVADSCPLLGHVVTSAKGASIHPPLLAPRRLPMCERAPRRPAIRVRDLAGGAGRGHVTETSFNSYTLRFPRAPRKAHPCRGHAFPRPAPPPHTLRDGLRLELRQTLGDVPGDAALDEEDAGLAGFDREHVKGSEQILPNACVRIEMFDDGGQTPALTQRGERARGRASHSPTSPAGATSRARRGRRGSRGQGQGARGRRARGGSASPRPLPHAEILRPLGRVVAHAPLDRHLLVEHADASRLRLLDRRPRTRLIAILVAAIRAALTADDEPVERLHRVTLLWIFRVCRRVDSDAPKNVHAPGVMDAR